MITALLFPRIAQLVRLRLIEGIMGMGYIGPGGLAPNRDQLYETYYGRR